MNKILGIVLMAACLLPSWLQGAGLTPEQKNALDQSVRTAQAAQQKKKPVWTQGKEQLTRRIGGALPFWAPEQLHSFDFWEMYLEPVIQRSGYTCEDFGVGFFDDKENPDRKGILNFYVLGPGPNFKTVYRIQFEVHNLGRGRPGVIPLKYGPADGPAI